MFETVRWVAAANSVNDTFFWEAALLLELIFNVSIVKNQTRERVCSFDSAGSVAQWGK